MPYARIFDLHLSAAGLTLTAMVFNGAGAQQGATISSGFTDLGAGDYIFSAAAIPDAFQGYLAIYAGGVYAACLSINPTGDAENCDQKSSVTLAASAYVAPDNSDIGTIKTNVASILAAAANLDASVSSRLAGSAYAAPDNGDIGTIKTNVASILASAANLDASVSSRLAASAYAGPDDADIATIAANVAAILAAAANLDASVSSRLAANAYTPPPAAAPTVGAINDALTAAHGAGSWAQNNVVAVDHNYGTTDALRAMSGGVPVDGAIVRAYLASEWDAGDYQPAGESATGSDGRWVAAILLAPSVYYIDFYKPGTGLSTRQTVTVTE
jgi:hypothetical protein